MEISDSGRELLPKTHMIHWSMMPGSLLKDSILITGNEGIQILIRPTLFPRVPADLNVFQFPLRDQHNLIS